jgi:hypothetical protein
MGALGFGADLATGNLYYFAPPRPLKSQKVAGVLSEIKSQYGGFVLTAHRGGSERNRSPLGPGLIVAFGFACIAQHLIYAVTAHICDRHHFM